jgi:TPR repeat protein
VHDDHDLQAISPEVVINHVDHLNTPRLVANTTSSKVAQALLKAGQYEEAFARLKDLANSGDGWASLHLGWMYHKGLACSADLDKAEQNYLRAYENGLPEAALYLGRVYKSMARYQDALRFLKEAASKEDPSAAYWAYAIYSDPASGEQDPRKATEFLEKAASLGHVFARRDLAKRMIRGKRGVSRIPYGIWSLIANVVRTARIAASDREDPRLR